MKIVDWRQVDARALALVFARERVRWLIDLGWDTRESWVEVEKARTGWGLPGLAALDDSGRVRGLTFFHATGRRFDLGGVFAESPSVRDSLLDAAIEICEQGDSETLSAFLYAGASPPAERLAERGFRLEAFDYLVASVDAEHDVRGTGRERERPDVEYRSWHRDDVPRVARLLHASYDAAHAHPFVASHTESGWVEYVERLVLYSGCGTLLEDASMLAWSGQDLVGAVLVTHLGPGTAHIAQLAVHPRWRRQRLADGLLDAAGAVIGQDGYGRLTLLTSSRNLGAQALYRGRGFVSAATFVSATKALAGAARRAS